MATQILTSSSPICNFESDCRDIHDSGSRLTHLLQVLAQRTRLERRQIKETYRKMYGEDLLHRLQADDGAAMSPEARSALSIFLTNPHERDAVLAREALEQNETNYRALAEIFIGRKSSHVVLIKQAYHAKFRRQLDQDIINVEPAHPFQRILVALAASHKAHQVDVSHHIAKCDARRLYETGEGRAEGGIEEAVLLEILSKRSIPQLKLTFSSYRHIYGHPYSKALKYGGLREFEDSLRMVVKCILNPPNYYAKLLHLSFKRKTKDQGAMLRTMVTRADIDLKEIASVFRSKHGSELKEAINESNLPGDYRDFIVALVSNPGSTTSN